MEMDESNAGSSKEEAGDASPGDDSGAPKSGSSGKICKKSPEQLHMLKSAFVRTQWPSPEEYDKLAEESGLARTDIVSWFGDTRYAWKNGNLKWYYYYQLLQYHLSNNLYFPHFYNNLNSITRLCILFLLC